ncbi:MAG TPA: hypothetical protein VEK08_26950 [Planctomycetota bacterium]|nr:hypothetical protein [Planctomycetota bacterium]
MNQEQIETRALEIAEWIRSGKWREDGLHKNVEQALLSANWFTSASMRPAVEKRARELLSLSAAAE